MFIIRVVCVLVCVVSFGVFAEEDGDWGEVSDVKVIQSTEVATKKSFQNYWDEHIYGSVSGVYRLGPRHYGISSEVKIGFNERWKQLKLVVDIAHRKELKSGGNIELRQAYLEYYPMQSFVLSTGKQTTVWGQLDIVSPVDLFLPLDFHSTGFTLSKIDNRMPQTVVRATYYPAQNIEVSGYYFPVFEESGLFKDVIDEIYEDKDSDRYLGDDGEIYELNAVKDKPSEGGYAGRAVWYNSKFTAGLTYYQGVNNMYPVGKQTFVEMGKEEYYDGSFADKSTAMWETRYGYYPKKGVGFEFALPIGHWSLKFDATISDELYDLGKPLEEYVQKYIDHNNGDTSIFIYRSMYVIGIDADFDTWFYNFYVTGIKDFKNPKYNDFLNTVGQEPDLISFFGLPTLNIGRYWNRDKKGGWGFALGFLGSNFGILGYASNEISESFSWMVSAGIVNGMGDILSVINAEQDKEKKDGTFTDYKFISDPTISLGLSYKL
mgnify:CR=1 FL=1